MPFAPKKIPSFFFRVKKNAASLACFGSLKKVTMIFSYLIPDESISKEVRLGNVRLNLRLMT